MIDFALSDEERMLVEAAESFGARHLRPNERAHEEAGAPSDEVRRAWVESGFDGLCEDDAGVSWPGRVAVLEALASADGAAAFALWVPAWSVWATRRLEDPASQVSGVTFHDALSPTPAATACVHLCGGTDVLALDSERGWGVARVEVTPIPALGLRAAGPVRPSHATWTIRGESPLVPSLVAEMRISGGALFCGIGRASVAYAQRYVQERIAFGKPISRHQGLAFLFAEAAMRMEAARLLVTRAAWDVNAGQSASAPDAWLESREAALFATETAVQLLGGHGYMKDHPVEKWMRDARALALLWGAEDGAATAAASAVGL